MIRLRLPWKRRRGFLPSGAWRLLAGLLENPRARPSPILFPGAVSHPNPASSFGSSSDGVRSRVVGVVRSPVPVIGPSLVFEPGLEARPNAVHLQKFTLEHAKDS